MIIGWESILAPLAAYYGTLSRQRNEELATFNLFVSGKPGTNKSKGLLGLSQFLGFSTELVDVSTIDDISELAGVVDLQANRERGESAIIAGNLLKAQILILDEFLNARQHVQPQFRLLLQRHLVLLGKKIDQSTEAIIATGNLSDDMERGDAALLDSPTADRFAMVIRVPSLIEMEESQAAAILEGRPQQDFMLRLKKAVDNIGKHCDAVEHEYGALATRYVLSLLSQLNNTPCAFEGRRGKLIRQFVLAAIALCRAEPERDLSQSIHAVVTAALSYHKLSGLPVDLALIKNAHDNAFLSISNASIDALIACERDIARKVQLLVENLQRVSPVTQAAVFEEVLSSQDYALRIACKELGRSPRLAGAPTELKAILDRMKVTGTAPGRTATAADLLMLSQASQMHIDAWEAAGNDDGKMEELLAGIRHHLASWGVDCSQDAPRPSSTPTTVTFPDAQQFAHGGMDNAGLPDFSDRAPSTFPDIASTAKQTT